MLRARFAFALILCFALVSTVLLWTRMADAFGKHAVVTLLTSSDDYVFGAMALATSLRRVSRDPMPFALVAMVTANVDDTVRDKLRDVGWSVRVVTSISNPSDRNGRFADTFTKLNAWRLVQFSRVVFIDADAIALQPIDALFRMPPLAAVPDCCDFFNSGVMVLQPSEQVFQDMAAKVALPEFASYDGGDQGFLNAYYGAQWTRLPYRWNAQLPDFVDLPSAWNVSTIAIMHFERFKPFRPLESYPGVEERLGPLFALWRESGGGDAMA